MKFTPEVIAALQVLKDNATNDFERHRITVLEQDLTSLPKVEVVDDTHQKFNGVSYRKFKNNHYAKDRVFIHQAVYQYHFGDIPAGYNIHHKDHNPANNDIDNLQMLTCSEHQKIHAREKSGSFAIKEFVCDYCGKKFSATITGLNRFCSPTCRRNFKRVKDLVIRNCLYCGKEFPTDKYSDVQCCSNSCAQKLKYVDAHLTKTCEFCGKDFTITKKNQNQRFCSRDCAHKAVVASNLEVRTCPVCGKQFSIRKSEKTIHCSKSCANVSKHRIRKEKSIC